MLASRVQPPIWKVPYQRNPFLHGKETSCKLEEYMELSQMCRQELLQARVRS